MNDSETTIFLIRHGEVHNPDNLVYGSAIDVPLSSEGEKQISALAEKLQQQALKPDAIYSSHLTRARHSARIISEKFQNVEIQIRKRLRDADGNGLEEKTLDWLKGKDYYHPSESEGIESEKPEEIVDRMTTVLEEIMKSRQGKTVFVVSHGDPLAFTMWQLLHPGKDLSSIRDLTQEKYLNKSEVWKVIFNHERRVVHHELISLGDDKTLKERGKK